MKKILSIAAMVAMITLAWNASGAAAVQKTPAKKTAAKKTVAKKTASPAKRSVSTAKKGTATTARSTASASKGSAARGGKKAPAKRVTWRNRQVAPSADRYREIQGALAAKGYLKAEDATGSWNQNSSDALKKFQAEQNLETSGKINSLSLIALGLGPRREAVPAKIPPPPPAQ